MKHLVKVYVAILFFATFLHAEDVEKSGTVSAFILKDGKPLINNEIIIDNLKSYRTDQDGWIHTTLPVGKHQLQVFGKENNGTNLGYIKKPFEIKNKRDTQIIAAFKVDDTLDAISIDTPVGQISDVNSTKIKSTGKGVINGLVLISNSKKPISGARVFVKGTAIDTRTDQNGRFSVTVPSDSNLSISVVHSAYSAQTLNDIVVEKEGSITKTVELTPASMELEEFVVLAPKIEGSIASALSEKRDTSTVADILGAEQMSKAGDSSAAGALKRVTGITLVGGKYVYIRGLGERYSSTLLNDLHLPSPEPTKRVVPMDMFPTSVIGSMMIQKTYTPDLPATFGGGTIKIRSKGTPDDFFVKFGLDLSYNDGATFKDGLSYDGGGSDWTGYDDGTRELPKSLLTATDNFKSLSEIKNNDPEKFNELSKELINKRDIGTTTKKIDIGKKISAAVGDNININENIDVGYTASYSYSSSGDRKSIRKVAYTFSDGKTDGTISSGGDNDISTYNYKHGGMFGLSADLYDYHSIKYTLLYILDSQDIAKVSDYHSNSADLDFKNTYLSWVERELLIHQFNGEHEFNDFGRQLNWGVEFGKATRKEPGTVEYSYEKVDTDKYLLSTSVASPVAYSTNDLKDDILNAKVSYKEPVSFFKDFYLKDFDDYIEVGAEHLKKSRSLESRTYSFADTDNTNLRRDTKGEIDDILSDKAIDKGAWELGNRYTSGDFYDAEQNLNAFFLKYHAQPIEKWEILVGARYEKSLQSLDTFSPDTDGSIDTITHELESNDILPALTLTYKATDDLQIRAGYSKSLTRPDFREFSENSYIDPVTSESVVGNSDLDYTKLNNLDLRVEYYFSDTENISFATFYKTFDRPIETVVRELGRTTRTFANADSATSLGFEIDFRKNFDIIHESLTNYVLYGNAAYINSAVTLDQANKEQFFLTTDDRPMQGQSPYVINMSLAYDNDKIGRNVNLSYNVFGKRIRALGTSQQPDYYEMPFHQVDFVWMEKIAKSFKIKFKAKNLLDDTVEWEQAGVISYSKKPGREYGLGFSYSYK